ncbi:hypothetical protein V8C40DRAFT_230036 [Trichoderma camerunense]
MIVGCFGLGYHTWHCVNVLYLGFIAFLLCLLIQMSLQLSYVSTDYGLFLNSCIAVPNIVNFFISSL